MERMRVALPLNPAVVECIDSGSAVIGYYNLVDSGRRLGGLGVVGLEGSDSLDLGTVLTFPSREAVLDVRNRESWVAALSSGLIALVDPTVASRLVADSSSVAGAVAGVCSTGAEGDDFEGAAAFPTRSVPIAATSFDPLHLADVECVSKPSPSIVRLVTAIASRDDDPSGAYARSTASVTAVHARGFVSTTDTETATATAFAAHSDHAWCAAQSSALPSCIVTGGDDCAMRLWDTRVPLRNRRGESAIVSCCAEHRALCIPKNPQVETILPAGVTHLSFIRGGLPLGGLAGGESARLAAAAAAGGKCHAAPGGSAASERPSGGVGGGGGGLLAVGSYDGVVRLFDLRYPTTALATVEGEAEGEEVSGSGEWRTRILRCVELPEDSSECVDDGVGRDVADAVDGSGAGVQGDDAAQPGAWRMGVRPRCDDGPPSSSLLTLSVAGMRGGAFITQFDLESVARDANGDVEGDIESDEGSRVVRLGPRSARTPLVYGMSWSGKSSIAYSTFYGRTLHHVKGLTV